LCTYVEEVRTFFSQNEPAVLGMIAQLRQLEELLKTKETEVSSKRMGIE
jgi:hypothetical protein